MNVQGGRETMAYEGQLWIDPATAGLYRMTIEVPDPPSHSYTCRVETSIEYGRSAIGTRDFLLPRLTVLKLWDMAAELHENRIAYSDCREFQTDSVFRTGPEPPAPSSAALRPPPAIPAGVRIGIALDSTIDPDTAFAGDLVAGRLVKPIRNSRGAVVVAAGAAVHGRIAHFEQRYAPAKDFVLGLQFDSIDANGVETPLKLTAIPHSETWHSQPDPSGQTSAVAMFVFKNKRQLREHRFVSQWKTE